MIFDEDARGTPQLSRSLEVLRSIWALDQAMRQLSRAMEQHLGVSGPQRLVLRAAAARPGIGAGELAELLHVDASTLSGHLTRLEEQGLLERRASPSDGRRTEVFLTPRGRRFDVKTPGTVEAAVDVVLADSDDGAVAVTEDVLHRLVAALEAQTTALTTPKRRRQARR